MKSQAEYEAYRKGYDAYLDGAYIQDNPYMGVNEHNLWEAWREGYFNAQFDD